MVVKRIVMNIAASQVDTARSFYTDILGLDVVMDLGWIITFVARSASAAPQISVASEGGSGTPVPDVSIEVDDLEEVLKRAEVASRSNMGQHGSLGELPVATCAIRSDASSTFWSTPRPTPPPRKCAGASDSLDL